MLRAKVTIPSLRAMIIGSDARCIEGCYTKTYMVKNVRTHFLWDQIQKGWTNPGDALWGRKGHHSLSPPIYGLVVPSLARRTREFSW